MNSHSEEPLDGQPSNSFQLNESKRLELISFLSELANTPLKVKILFYFLSQPTLCMSSCHLGEQLGASELHTQNAAKELAACGAFSYCPYFAYTDLCHLASPSYSKEVQEHLNLLFNTLRFEPEFVWNHFDSSLNS